MAEWGDLASPRLVVLGTKNWSKISIMYYVYIIYSQALDKIYKGFTGNLKNRFAEHNAGKVKTTKNDSPWKLIYYEAFMNKTDAMREELFLKSGKGKERIKFLLKETHKISKNKKA